MRWEISPPTDRGNQTCVPISRRRKDTKQRPPHPRAPFDQAQAKGGVSPMRTHLADQWFRSTCRYSSFTETNYADLCCHCSLLLRVWTGRRHTCTPSTALSPSIKCKGLSPVDSCGSLCCWGEDVVRRPVAEGHQGAFSLLVLWTTMRLEFHISIPLYSYFTFSQQSVIGNHLT